jgi:hypothetical protein
MTDLIGMFCVLGVAYCGFRAGNAVEMYFWMKRVRRNHIERRQS